MTLYLALDPVTGFAQTEAGYIAGINPTARGIEAAGFASGDGYTGNRLVTIDETDDTKWDDECAPGWYWVNGVVQEDPPLTNAQQVAHDIERFKAAVETEAVDWEQVVAEENFQPHTDSGHAWSDDLLHSLIKPNIRLQVTRLETAKGTPNAANIAAYTSPTDGLSLDLFIAAAAYGVVNIYRNATKSVWRAKRTGENAYGYDVVGGGVRQAGSPLADVMSPVTYPTGTTVVTYDALAAVRGL